MSTHVLTGLVTCYYTNGHVQQWGIRVKAWGHDRVQGVRSIKERVTPYVVDMVTAVAA